ncbi:MAG: hypothetical protein AB7U46_09725 [Paenirhodobacter sp.]|uniref:hypothetical protein n=1 Tax=Paenirhodobacter sp. TaxID=1965326 RepID=UPI003D10ED75
MRRGLILALLLGLMPQGLRAEPPVELPEGASACRILAATGDRFCKFGNRWRLMNPHPAAYAVGEDFPVYEQSMLMDLARYGLPPVDGPWRYYLRDGFIYKVSAQSAKVVEVVGRARHR